LIGKGLIDGQLRGLLYQPAQTNFKTDKTGVGPFTWAQLQSKALGGTATITFMGVPPGSGVRMGIDRDSDGVLDGDETPTTPISSYGAPSPPCAGNVTMGVNSAPFIGNSVFAFTCTNTAPNQLSLGIITNNPDFVGTPILGFTLLVDMTSPEVYGINMVSDPSGFSVGPVSISDNPLLVGKTYAAQTITLAPCASNGLAASQGLIVTIVDSH
jgi:hypothetical protein